MRQFDTATVRESAFSNLPASGAPDPLASELQNISIDYFLSKLKTNSAGRHSSSYNFGDFPSRETGHIGNLVADQHNHDEPLPSIKHTDPHDIVTFSPMQEWEGYVTEIFAESFSAYLIDKTAEKSIAEELMEFSISDLSEDNKDLLKVGAIFRWAIGYQKQHGSKRKVSEVVFRRMPAITKRDIKHAESRVDAITEALTWI